MRAAFWEITAIPDIRIQCVQFSEPMAESTSEISNSFIWPTQLGRDDNILLFVSATIRADFIRIALKAEVFSKRTRTSVETNGGASVVQVAGMSYRMLAK